jgi:hypothetical protein
MTIVSYPILRSVLAAAIFTTGLFVSDFSFAGEDADQAALLQALANSKLTLADGLKQAAKGSAAPISAKFEFDDNKHLSLSVYVAEKGLGVDSEHNVLQELSGSPEKAPWVPEAEVFKDVPHVARASEQLTVTALSKHSLLDVVSRAQKAHAGSVVSITPAIHGKRPVYVVGISQKGKLVEYTYDAITDKPLASGK